ncbi:MULTISPECIES: glutamate--tRNA ligase [unclassified Burkholderia]|uniref:glutamate--tRNA ligase n=1 Tax=unclassified Burkholderia TaxID=2613784 RepID=UPI000468DB5A|nr:MULTISPECIES: glutamate--tRNA ligase [unclassified Burkholderia]NIE85718.1 glutamate--tRNA ligase [Burkholderia sp. Tr-860]NIF64764.1 glutamate--tRNA ligase [Burkholderia sp. Cy-647]NIF72732.1 glutamate--tRNA ligase [Burkholderia sp. Ap-962]NIF89402.1 glutamate--tRNA ligase [Burkholderia sp. Cy-637]NIF99551.1 glutamate--tRNA ligase [Burkholderia sp. Ax-1720]
MTRPVRTRFAPSPTGFIHLGNIRSALYPWAFARSTQGAFVLRIEDTDLERSSEASVDAILEGMKWLDLDFDEGPFYQMQRMDRYRAVLAQMLEKGLVYPCYMSTEELDALRERQREAGEKPRYDGTWRPEPGKLLPEPPAGVQPVLRFRNPLTGSVVWDDAVKGRIEISNEELDDLVIARPDGTPTYNFCVVVDDLDMQITHVIRGDDHVNNTPRQINILRALGGEVPVYAHLPTVLNEQGEKMSKRHGAMSVMGYRDAGYLPEAVLNYLARLGWSHGDAEIFSREQFVSWFDLEHLGKSPAQYDHNKLNWLNNHYIKEADNARLAELAKPFFAALGIDEATLASGADLPGVIGLMKDRASTVKEIVDGAAMFYRVPAPDAEELAQRVTDAVKPALAGLAEALKAAEWSKEGIAAALKATLAEHGLKMPQLAMPVRLLVVGTTHTPSLDAVLALLDRNVVISRLAV